MKNRKLIVLIYSIVLLCSWSSGFAQEKPVQYPFSGVTMAENNVSIQGAGFGQYPMANVSFEYIPTDNAFNDATDGHGMVVRAKPGEGIMIFLPRYISQNAASIRCTVRTEQAGVISIAAIGDAPDVFVAVNSPYNQNNFFGKYSRISTIVTPPSGGFIPLIQVLNTSQTEEMTAYIDNYEIYPIEKMLAYHGEYLNGDENDPASDKITSPIPEGAGMAGPWGKLVHHSGNKPFGTDGVSVDNFIRMNFSGQTDQENGITLQGADFGKYPQANVSYGYIPTDNAFEGATDGQGVIIQAKPGEGVMLFGPTMSNNEAAMIRCSMRTEGADASVYIASIGAEPDRFVSTNTTNNPTFFQDQYKRIAVFATPPCGGLQPVIQIINTSTTETLTAYLDNFDIIILDKIHYYFGEFLNADETDPADGKIGMAADNNGSGLEAFPVPNEYKAMLGKWVYNESTVLGDVSDLTVNFNSTTNKFSVQITNAEGTNLGTLPATASNSILSCTYTDVHASINYHYDIQFASLTDAAIKVHVQPKKIGGGGDLFGYNVFLASNSKLPYSVEWPAGTWQGDNSIKDAIGELRFEWNETDRTLTATVSSGSLSLHANEKPVYYYNKIYAFYSSWSQTKIDSKGNKFIQTINATFQFTPVGEKLKATVTVDTSGEPSVTYTGTLSNQSTR